MFANLTYDFRLISHINGKIIPDLSPTPPPLSSCWWVLVSVFQRTIWGNSMFAVWFEHACDCVCSKFLRPMTINLDEQWAPYVLHTLKLIISNAGHNNLLNQALTTSTFSTNIGKMPSMWRMMVRPFVRSVPTWRKTRISIALFRPLTRANLSFIPFYPSSTISS